MSAPNCYKCVHRHDIAGDAHSRCVHPEVSGDNELTSLLNALFGARTKSPINAVGEPHGIANGWFMHPVNFDPAWLLSCDGFEEKKNV